MMVCIIIRLMYGTMKELSNVENYLLANQQATICYVQPAADAYVKTNWIKRDGDQTKVVDHLMKMPGVTRVEVIYSKG